MASGAVVYFTSNREDERFEGRIRRSLLRVVGGLPVISVSQQPLDFGQNIVVGTQTPSTQNALRQLQIGAQAATADHVYLAESDFLYPRDYFTFQPRRARTAYIATPIYVLFALPRKAKVFALKRGRSDSAMVVEQTCLVEAIETLLAPYGMWGEAPITFDDLLNLMGRRSFELSVPAITFKTAHNMHAKTPYARQSLCRTLPGWGTSEDLVRKYLA